MWMRQVIMMPKKKREQIKTMNKTNQNNKITKKNTPKHNQSQQPNRSK